MQEVEQSAFENDLLPFFRSLGFDGEFQTTKNEYPIATALFWRARFAARLAAVAFGRDSRAVRCSLLKNEWIDNRSRSMLSMFTVVATQQPMYLVNV